MADIDPRLLELDRKIEEMEAREEWTEVTKVYEESIRLSIEIYGETHPVTLSIYSDYGGLLRNLGRYEQSQEILAKAIRIAQALYGPDHPNYASALVNLANLFRMMGNFEESETFFLQAREIYERTIGKDHFLYASLINNLGLLYQDTGRPERSIPLHEECIGILGKMLDVPSPDFQDWRPGMPDTHTEVTYGVTLNNLVEPYQKMGKENLAIHYLKQAIKIFKAHIGQASTLYAAAINNLGSIHFKRRNLIGAKECFEKAKEISLQRLGQDSESYQVSKTNLDKLGQYTSPGARHITEDMRGLDLAEAYFFDVCYPMLEREFHEELPRMAAGLAGEGSECYGYDDQISRDHDWGPSFQIFLCRQDIQVFGDRLRKAIAALPADYAGFAARNVCTLGEGRVGVLTIEDFYDKYLSIHNVPSDNRVWLAMEDPPLSTATNGRIFMDNLGTFTQIREGLLKHYPKDVCLKKMAACCMSAAQSGQYNLGRCLQRGEYVAAWHCLDEFMESFTSIVYLLNKKYKPYYKWEHRGLKDLPLLGQETHQALMSLATSSITQKPDYIVYTVENLCKRLVLQFRRQGLTDTASDFLLDQGPRLLANCKDENIRKSNPWLAR